MRTDVEEVKKMTEESADFSLDELAKQMKRPDMGCIVIFMGIVRGDDGVKGLNVSAESENVKSAMNALCEEAKAKFDISDVKIVHKTGFLSVGENISAILVGAAHRKDAFKACEFIIDRLKMGTVPLRREEIRIDNGGIKDE